MPEAEDITALLRLAENGDRAAAARLVEVLYAELKRVAGACLRSERRDHTLQATALVHEAYLRLAGERHTGWQNRRHFLTAAAQVMRRVLVDCARARKAQKRGGGMCKVELDSNLPLRVDWAQDFLDVDAALEELASVDARQARVVELRFFAGLTEAEIAETVGVSERTVKREWEFARAWLHGRLVRRAGKQSAQAAD
jgi:RNA polymerase sigma factor (TIGR02999 family)